MTTFRMLASEPLHKHYEDYCDECDQVMDYRSRDGLQVFCTNCWVPKPVPLEYLGSNARLDRVNELKTLQEQANT